MKEKGCIKKVFPKKKLKEVLFSNMNNNEYLCFLTSVQNKEYVNLIVNDCNIIVSQKDIICIIKDLSNINYKLLNNLHRIYYLFSLTKNQVNKIYKNGIPDNFFIRREFVIIKKLKVRFIITNDDLHPFDDLKILISSYP